MARGVRHMSTEIKLFFLLSIPCTALLQQCIRKSNGRVIWFSFYSTHTENTDTLAMEHFPGVFFHIEIPVPPMYHHPLLPLFFCPIFPLVSVSLPNHEGHTWVVYSRLVGFSLCWYEIIFTDIPLNPSSKNHIPVLVNHFFELFLKVTKANLEF